MEQPTYQPPALVLPASLEALTPVQKGWLQLCQFREQTFADLQKQELAIQATLKPIEAATDLAAVQTTIASAKRQAAAAKEQRLHFTGYITDRLFVQAMEFEKRNDLLIKAAEATEFQLRKKEAEATAQLNKKATEIAALQSHIKNEYFRIAHKYRTDLAELVSQAYTQALSQKVEPGEKVAEYKETIQKFLKDVKLDLFTKFNRTLVTQEEAMYEFQKIPGVNAESILKEYTDKLDADFEMYEQDLQNAETAILAAQQKKDAEALQMQNQVQIEQATNTLLAQSAPMLEGPVIKEKLEIVEENTEAWGQAVISLFMMNWHLCAKHLKVKSWSKLTIAQMAAALSKEGKTGNLKTKIVEK